MRTTPKDFMGATVRGAVVSMGITAGLLMPRGGHAALPPETFFAKSPADAISAVLGAPQAPIDEAVELVVPGTVEVADFVPVSVNTAVDKVESITIVANENPNPIVANFRLDPQLVPYVATRVRLAKAGNMQALVKAGGTVHRATKDIGVTLGGCGDSEPGPEDRPEAKIPPNNVLLRAAKGDDGVVVRAIITHPMTPPSRPNPKSGNAAPGHFIQEVTAQLNGHTVLHGDWSPGVSQNPYLSFKIRGARMGDMIRVNWVDNEGMTGSSEVKVE
jgi:sulfur-oxidizing protein SoxY